MTGVAAMVSALTGVFVVLYQMGIIDIPKSGDRSESSQSGIVDPGDSPPAPTPEQPSGTDSNKAASSNTPLPKLSSASSKIDGVWEVRLTATQKISQDGFIDDYSDCADFIIIFKSAGNGITGEVRGARSCSGRKRNICREATINGTIDGRNVKYTRQFYGSCCGDERTTFTGYISEEGNSLIGKDEPVGIPSSSCSLWWGDVVGNKRSQNQ